MRGLGLPLALLAGAFAGCIGGRGPEGAGPEAAPTADEAASYQLSCPPGRTTVRAGVCVGSVRSATQSSQQPFLALHPRDPDVLALVVNRVDRPGGTLAPQDASGAWHVDVLFSEDAGATWRTTTLPRAPVPSAAGFPDSYYYDADVTAVFDDDGVLHVSGLAAYMDPGGRASLGVGVLWPFLIAPVAPAVGDEHSGVYSLSTPDLGRTWSAHVVMPRDPYQNNPKIVRAPDGTLYVSWWTSSETDSDRPRIAWSSDSGATWRATAAQDEPRDCWSASAVAVHVGEPLVACAAFDRDDGVSVDWVRVYAFDTATGLFTVRADLRGFDEGAWGLRLLSTGGSLVLLTDGHVARSADGGRTWSERISVAALGPAAGAEGSVRAAAADPWGGVHLLVASPDCEGDLTAVARATGRCPVALSHVALEASTLRVLDATLLTARDDPAPEESSGGPTFALSRGDAHDSIAFGPIAGILAWSRDKGVDLARIQRTPGAPVARP